MNDVKLSIELEDFHEDILAKAMRGLSIGTGDIAERIGVEKSKIEQVLAGRVDEEVILLMAKALDLAETKLLNAANKSWNPEPITLDGLKQFNLPFGGMRVNAYVVWSKESRQAWLFDTGPMVEPILDFLTHESLSLDSIFLTHTHPDHIACLEELKQKTGNPLVFVHKLESLEGVESIEEGFEYVLGNLSLKALHTHGHSAGGVSYLIDGLEKPVAVVGDALFAGSMGGGMVSYTDALRNNREKLMTLPDETIVCPGHGPMTTIGEEKQANPFFPEFSGAI
ncbi:MAG: MBL fold metallo-hydrolase [Verrucomicrobia bacterium]|nr:MBL fold metallo-hydrolase [Verrucomicrobiota bacterium]